MAKEIVVVLEKVKDTKNTVRFEAEDGAVDTLYIQKADLDGLPGGRPDKVRITITAA